MEISIENAEKKFTEHLNHLNNDRILFSGKFGTGKSYFLKKYFKNREKDYNLFWLTPVNYVVGANQDIFEWIKTDIAKELLDKEGFSKKDEQFGDNLLIQTYLYTNTKSIFASLLAIIGSETIKAATGFDALDSVKEWLNGFEKFKEGINEEGESDEKKILSFLDDATQIKGSIYEDDLTTQIIRASIELLKKNTEKENVLVIDDLDRLDPEHIFRILNIMSAHNSHFDSNKFGFDKVILVCDYENIQHIYEYKYGEKVDFQGYIEKFYTYEPFYFTIYDAIVNYCHSEYAVENLSESEQRTLIFLLSWLYKHEQLRVRNLKKIASGLAILHNKDFGRAIHDLSEGRAQNNHEIDYNQYGIIKILWLLSVAFGSIDNLHNSLQSLSHTSNYVIGKTYIAHLTKTVPLFEHIAKNSGKDSLFYNWINHPTGGSILRSIEVKFLGRKYIIDTAWDSFAPYSKGDYFVNASLRPIGQNDTHVDGISMLLESLSGIVEFIKREKIFSNTSL